MDAQRLNMNNRMVAQQSVFVFGEGSDKRKHFQVSRKSGIDAVSKMNIIKTLKKYFGIKEQPPF